jgi:hypothetical protein
MLTERQMQIEFLHKTCRLTPIEIAKEFNVDPETISREVRENNLNVEMGYRTWMNHWLFDDIISEIPAYILGYFVADGSLQGDRFSFCCSIDDLEILAFIHNTICPDSHFKIFKNTKDAICRKVSLSVRFSSRRLAAHIRRLKLDKTSYDDITFPTFSYDTTRHFIRGMFDGDGHYRRDRSRYELSIIFSDPYFADSAGKQITLDSPYTYRVTPVKSKNKTTYVLYIQGKGGKKREKYLYDYLYKDATLFLQRKKSRFLLV